MIAFIGSTVAAVFSMVNPLGAIPLYLSLTEDYSPNHRKRVNVQISLYTIAILMVFFWLGIYVLDFFGIDINALKIAGGFIIVLSGYGLMSGKIERSRSIDKRVRTAAHDREDISFAPMAMPMLAGPGSISFLINLNTEIEVFNEKLYAAVSILIIGVIVFITLHFSKYLFKLLGQSGLRAMARIMGFFVMAIGTQYLITGIVHLVKLL